MWGQGIRYRFKNSDIIGKPDITIRVKKLAIFVDGEFYRGFNWDEKKEKIKSNRDYWIPKIKRNIQLDLLTNKMLADNGWKVIRLWESQIKNNIDACYRMILLELKYYQVALNEV